MTALVWMLVYLLIGLGLGGALGATYDDIINRRKL